jgi:hypothetical protein
MHASSGEQASGVLRKRPQIADGSGDRVQPAGQPFGYFGGQANHPAHGCPVGSHGRRRHDCRSGSDNGLTASTVGQGLTAAGRLSNGLIGPEAVSPTGKPGMISQHEAHTPALSYAAHR